MRLLFFAVPLLLAGLAVSQAPDVMGVSTCRCTGDIDDVPEDHAYYGTDYGTSCAQAWDETKDYCDPLNPEYKEDTDMRWCQEKWCYVDQSCVVTKGDRTFGAMPTDVFKQWNVELFWSYETCGSTNYYEGTDGWNFTINYAEVCECTGSNDGNPNLEGTNTGKWCDAWDSRQDYCDPDHETWNPTNQLWCPEPWCYVQRGCQAEYQDRNWTSTRSVYIDNAPLYWSYEHCGAPNFFSGAWNYTLTPCNQGGRDVYFLVDSSDSVKNDWEFIRTGVSRLIGHFNSSYDRVGLIIFGGTTNDDDDNDYLLVHNLTADIDAVEEAAFGMDRLKSKKKKVNPHTWTYGAINFTLDQWTEDEYVDFLNDDESDRVKILVIVTDGKPNPKKFHNPCDDEINKWHPTNELVERGIIVKVFAIRLEPVDFVEMHCLVEDPAKDVIKISNPEAFFDDFNNTSDIFCIDTKTRPPTPPGCTVISEPKDVVLVLDSSKSMYTKKNRLGTARENWLETMVDLQNVVCLYNSLADRANHRCAFGPRDNVGLVRFATDVKVEHDATRSAADWWDGLKFTKMVNGVLEPALPRKSLQFMTDTVAGLWSAFEMMERINPVEVVKMDGEKKTKRREVILITDGRPHCKRDEATLCRPCASTWRAQTLVKQAMADAKFKMIWKGDRATHDGRISVDKDLLASDEYFGCLDIDFDDGDQFVAVSTFHELSFRDVLLGEEVCLENQM